jgi:hypothetical protein
MTLFFNIDVLEKETDGDSQYLIVALERWYNKHTIPINARQKYKPLKKSLSGSSFLLNPDKFFKDRNTDVIFRAQYLKLAARRDYTLYKLYGLRTLDLSFFPNINLQLIEANPLLSIIKNNLHFKYEDI